MFGKSMQYSYKAQKNKRNRLLNLFILFFILFIAYNCLSFFFFSVWVVENDTMQPEINAGDRLIFSSFMPPWNITDENPLPFRRGNIVLIDMRHERNQRLPVRIADTIVRFFTAQRVSIFQGRGQFYVKRLIALPGDEISMNNYVFRVRTDGSLFSLTENELSHRPYHPFIPQTMALWDESIPFSGTMNTLILGPDECFVVSDDRTNTNDSRTWGPISPSQITARAVLRFWPLNRIGLL